MHACLSIGTYVCAYDHTLVLILEKQAFLVTVSSLRLPPLFFFLDYKSSFITRGRKLFPNWRTIHNSPSPNASSGFDLVGKIASNTVGSVLHPVGLVLYQHLAVLQDSSWCEGAKVQCVLNEYVLSTVILFCLN